MRKGQWGQAPQLAPFEIEENFMQRFIALAAIGIGLGLADKAFADLAPPLPAVREYKIRIEVDEKAKARRMIVPGGAFAPVGNPRFGPKGELPQNSEEGVA